MIYLAITTLIWAFSFGLIGNALKGVNPMQVADARLLIALLVFLPFLKPGHTTMREKVQLIAIGAVQFGIMYSCYLSAFTYLPSHLVALFSVFTPLYVVMIYNLRRRKFTPWYLLAAVFAVSGAAVIKFQHIRTDDIWLGFALMQLAGIAFAFGQVCYRDWKQARPDVSDSAVFAFLYLGAGLFTGFVTILVFNAPPIPLDATPTQWLVMTYLGLIASGLGFFFWNKGATQTNPGALAAFNNAVVPLAMFTSLFVFGEATGGTSEQQIRLALGSVLIVIAVLVGKRNKTCS